MKPLTSLPRVGARLGGLSLIAAGLIFGTTAFAQTTYSVRKLVTQVNDTKSELKVDDEAISNNGDVAALSKEVSGLIPVYAPNYGLFAWPVIGYRVVRWSADASAVTVLSVPAGGKVVGSSMRGIDGTGRILASVSGLFGGSTWTWWSGTQRTTLTPSLTGFPAQWVLGRVNSNGEVPAFTNATKKRVVVLSGKSTVRELPLPPDDFLKSSQGEFNSRWGYDDRRILMNDKGQVALLVTPTMNATNQNQPQRLWFWDGKAWLDITPKPPIDLPAGKTWQYRMSFMGLNNAGQMLIFDNGFLADAATGAWDTADSRMSARLVGAGLDPINLPAEVVTYAYLDNVRLADNGDVLFTRSLKDPRGQFGEIGSATIWRNGQIIDVNSLTEGLSTTEWVGSVQEVSPNGRLLVYLNTVNGISGKAVLNPK